MPRKWPELWYDRSAQGAQRLGDAVDALPGTLAGAAADALKEGVAALLEDDRLPAVFPDTESAEEPAVPPLAAYADLPDWTERHLPGRVAFAGRALRSLKSTRFEDVALVGRAVALLGTTYHMMKTEGGTELRKTFEDELRGLRLQETPSISPDRQGCRWASAGVSRPT